MIDESLLAFFALPVFGFLGTRDADNKPQAHRVWGWRPSKPPYEVHRLLEQ